MSLARSVWSQSPPSGVAWLAPGLALALGVLAAAPAAQEPAPRPRIGLVLSGGGARGAAHAGVLAVLEEMRVPVDFVVGTSMGAIVGGLYAYGLSPAELQALLVRDDMPDGWDYLLLDGPRRRDLGFRRKEEERRFLSDIRIGVRDGALAFPKGLLQGQNLEIELRCATAEAHDLRTFDDLPLPFRCLAVDIRNGERVVLEGGNLADALRASMSLPGIFAPVQIDGRLLIDGGILDNVPVDVARDLGAEVLIVVDIGTPLDTEADVADLFAVTGKMVAILTEQNVRQSRASLRPEDVLLTPDLGDITSADFERADESIAIGARTARAMAERLGRLAVPAAEYERFLARQRRPPRPWPVVRSIAIANDSGFGEEAIATRLGVAVGAPLDEAALRAGCERLFGTDDLERVSFALRDWREGAADLYVGVEEKGWGPSYLRLGLGLESNFEGESLFNLSALYNARLLDPLGAEWRTRVQVGNENLLESEYYQPLDAAGRWFVAPRLVAEREPARLFQQGQLVAEADVSTATLGLDGGRQLGNWGELRVGAAGLLGDLDLDFTTLPVPPDRHFQDGYARTLLQVDTLDNARFPGAGSLGRLEWQAGLPELGGDTRYDRVEARWLQALSLGEHTALVPTARFVSATRGTLPVHAQPTLGGFLNLSGFPRDSFRDQHTGLLALVGHHRLAGSAGAFGLPLYIGGSFEAGNVWTTRSAIGDEWILAGSVFLAVDTPLGPGFLAYGQAEGGEQSVYFFFGPWL